jgi:membrane associated rhomboid family serine protease
VIPIRDSQPSESLPFISLIIIISCAYFFWITASLEPTEVVPFITSYSMTPVSFMDGSWLSQKGVLELPGTGIVSYMFLHGGVMHLVGNMWSLWIFGDNVEDKFGHFSFLIFYLLCGVIALVTHSMVDAGSNQPMIGASGSIAGVMGAYLVLHPRATVLVLVPIFLWPLYFEVPSIIFMGVWGYTQVASGIQSLGAVASTTEASVAWWAHVGGFLGGIALVPFFRSKKR